MGEWDRTEACCQKAIAADPEQLENYVLLAQVYLARDELDAAKQCYRHALSLDPRAASVHAMLGFVHHRRQRWENVVRCFSKAVRYEPDQALYHLMLGNAHFQLRHYPQAANSFVSAIERAPDLPHPYHQLGNVWLALDQFDEAEHAFADAQARDPAKLVGEMAHAIKLAQDGNHDEGTARLRQLCHRYPRVAQLQVALGNLLLQNKDYEAACEAYENALRENPGLTVAHCKLGETQALCGHIEEACMAYKEAERLDPQLAQAHAKLTTLCQGEDNRQAAQLARQHSMAAETPDLSTDLDIQEGG
jgi:tetratricopeptide (TPR) repeat protein